MSGRNVLHAHHGRRRGDDFQFAARADPVDVAVAVHDDGRAAKDFRLRTNQLPLISAVPIRSENAVIDIGYR